MTSSQHYEPLLFLLYVSTDVSVTKQLIVYCQYVANGDVTTRFLHIAALPDGLAVTITNRIHQLCTDLDLDLQKFCGLGSDGASVMLGKRGGVSTLLKQTTPYLVATTVQRTALLWHPARQLTRFHI